MRVAAEHLYPRYAFEHIRAECVRHMEPYTTDYARGKNAGMLVHRIKNAPYKPLDDAERMDTHYLLWRTDAERAADQCGADGAPVTGTRTSVAVSSEPAPDSLPDKPAWRVERLDAGNESPDPCSPLPQRPPADPEWERRYAGVGLSGMDRRFDGCGGVRR